MARGKQFSVFLPNRPGELAKLCSKLAVKKVNIRAISVAEGIEHGVVRMVTDKAVQTRRVLAGARLSFTESPVLLVTLPNVAGVLLKAAKALAKEKVNINYVYGSAVQRGAEALIVMNVSDIERARKVLGA